MLVTGDTRCAVQQPARDRRKEHVRGIADHRDQTDGGTGQAMRNSRLLQQREIHPALRVDAGNRDEEIRIDHGQQSRLCPSEREHRIADREQQEQLGDDSSGPETGPRAVRPRPRPRV